MVGLREPWGEAVGRAGGRREVLKHRQWWKRDACSKYKNFTGRKGKKKKEVELYCSA